MITEQQIQELVDKIVSEYDPDKVILFGSFAGGTANENSDVDLLVVKDSDLPRYKRGIELRTLLHKYRFMYPFDLLVYTNSELIEQNKNSFSFLFSVLNNGKVYYEK